ncbi:WD40/YVTN/BNR-like repeat-containing protein [Oleiharenicola lentus]|uniref:WD40/YVTN/BNR-like repeat-containing protein n=1 Tax=Oleiharenicola lentus TaxID=2508720 RepID=UPI003F67160A
MRFLFAVLTLVLALACSPSAAKAETSELAPLAAKSLLLDIATAGNSLVAVGERGHVVISHDNGQTWTQSLTPTRALLTAVAFPDAQHGWAVGHDGVILATADSGKTWQRQDAGHDLETIFLDVLFLDAQRGFIVGAYGKFLLTTDGGKTWTPSRPSEEDVHYNRLTRDGAGWLYLAGESGTLLISRDGGVKWSRAEVPYEGSLYGVIPIDRSRLITYGLRGNIFVSTDSGATWNAEQAAVKVLIMGGTVRKDGTVILAGIGGNFFIGRDGEFKFTTWKPDGFGTSVADLIIAADGTLVTVGEAGAVRLTLPQ